MGPASRMGVARGASQGVLSRCWSNTGSAGGWGRLDGWACPCFYPPLHLNCIFPRLKPPPFVAGHLSGTCAGAMRAEVTASF